MIKSVKMGNEFHNGKLLHVNADFFARWDDRTLIYSRINKLVLSFVRPGIFLTKLLLLSCLNVSLLWVLIIMKC